MKRLQLLRWSGSVLSPRIRPLNNRCRVQQVYLTPIRLQSSATPALASEQDGTPGGEAVPPPIQKPSPWMAPSPHPEAADHSPKLAALHSRLSLPSKLPLQTLARTLVDPSADPSSRFNNKSLSMLGNDLLSYYMSEYLLCTYPRLPMSVLWAAMYSYIGPRALTSMAREWGVEYAAVPGSEVDPGLLQFKRLPAGSEVDSPPSDTFTKDGELLKRSQSARVIYSNEFGDPREPSESSADGATPHQACANFTRAVMGAVYLHGGRSAAKDFFKEHFMSRHLDIANLFSFSQPTRDLSKLCKREGFAGPVARILSETGRLSHHPVFVVGIFSGEDKLGEGSGGSLDEARFRAAAAALKGWYLYSPLGVRLPSSMEEEGAEPWTPLFVDPGEIIV
ncbi:hypothetical protein AJ80_07090 [Polytolypa hystricis UAMH7299]|uniref:Large ribosomal subunit protein mL44 n=1 Tax=Polytolypa hystricis (strain UAMH7299) TaxID=1447883 RepID=A0A2B7XIH1_POLH7|nr:hypothetical protein AJ80_07090 [Polytolypa hystricis UAMH7299]